MKKLNAFLFLLVLLALFSSCSKENNDDDKNNNDDDNNQTETTTNKYLGSGSYGDVITYEVDEEANTYKYNNETTGQSDSGTFTYSTDENLSAVYEVTLNGSETYYAIELADEAFATSLPSGRADNALCFSISNEIDLSTDYSASEIAGKYLYIMIYDIENQTSSELYGGYDIKEDGTYTWAYGPADPADFSDNFSGGGSGTWEISSTDPSRIIFTEGGTDYIGTIYPGKAMLIDNGVGYGFSLGVKYPDSPVSQASIAGKYHFLDIMGSEQGVGYFTLPASGFQNLDQYMKYNGPTGEITDPTITGFERVSAINNMFKITSNPGNDDYYTYCMLLPGEIMMHFCLNPDGVKIESYGLSAKID